MQDICKVLILKAILLVAFSYATAEKNTNAAKEESIFVRTFRELHRYTTGISDARNTHVPNHWIEQKLDQFNESDTRTWQMRYFSDGQHFRAGGPMFILVGGEGEISGGHLSPGMILVDMAKQHKGWLFVTEHRYYGASKPTSNLSIDNLKYLHVKQALADLAHFIRLKKQTDSKFSKSKVIIVGGSYSASMVIWLKRLYPDLIDGGWASSAPILAKVDFVEYSEIASQSYQVFGSEECLNRIKNGFAELERVLYTNRSDEIKKKLKICENFDEHNEMDVSYLFKIFFVAFASKAQFQRKSDIQNFCNNMSFHDDLSAVINFLLENVMYKNDCEDFTYKNNLEYMSSLDYTQVRAFYFQKCNEFGWFQSSGSVNQPFGIKFSLSHYLTMCKDLFGSSYTSENIYAKVAQTNKDFGGMNPNVTDIYVTHGALDPWSVLGHNELQGATVLPGAAHCADFNSISINDTAEMRASKERLGQLISKWLVGSKCILCHENNRNK